MSEPERLSDLNLLTPPTRTRAVQLEERAAAAGIPIKVIETLRRRARQAWLYAAGRTREGKIVTNAKPGYGWHEYSRAFDVVILDAAGKAWWDAPREQWDRIGAIGERLGLSWGGRFRFADLGHFEYTRLDYADALKLELFERLLAAPPSSGLEADGMFEEAKTLIALIEAGAELPA